MQTAILVLTLATMGISVARDTTSAIKAIKAVHHHTTSVIYHKVLKPVGKELSK
jgi:hypothetical protein